MNKVVLGDCLDVMSDIKDKSIDLVVVDPPYGITKCKWDTTIDLNKMWEHLNRIVKDNCPILIFGSEPFMSTVRVSNISNYKYDWVWQKNCPSNIACANFQPMRYTEYIAVFYKGKPKFNKQMIPRSDSGKRLIKGYQDKDTTFKLSKSNVSSVTSTEVSPNRYSTELKNPSNVIYFNTVRGKKHHTTQKPLDLIKYFIKTYTDENDTVLDFCAGSGTTGIACEQLKRKYYLIEKDENYYNVILKRLKNEKS